MNVAFCSSEVYPFAKTGGLGDVCGSLPLALEKLGINVAIFLPGYWSVGQAGHQVEQLNGQVSRAIIGGNVHVYFIDHQEYFDRERLYGDSSGDYKDNIERFGFFCEQVFGVLKQVDFPPDIVHCHDWQTALIPVYLKEKFQQDPFYKQTRSLLTIHNLAFQGVFPKEAFKKLGFEESQLVLRGFDFYGKINLLKAGIIASDKVVTVSPQYAKEIRTQQFGCGLEEVLSKRHDVAGILNGIDQDLWNPDKDPYIAMNYNQDDFTRAKAKNKMQLQKKLFLEVREDLPLFGFVGRLTHQKGMNLVLGIIDDLIQMNAQIVFLGIGDEHYETQLKKIASRYPERVAACLEFNEPLGHQIYAGSDIFLMPSEFEPCGLSQMISLRYGTIPVVYKVGGLVDTISPFGFFNDNGNGFMFTQYNRDEFLKVIKKTMAVFAQKKVLARLRKNALRADYSWESSARKYQELYQCM